jgi:hypothetical protein
VTILLGDDVLENISSSENVHDEDIDRLAERIGAEEDSDTDGEKVTVGVGVGFDVDALGTLEKDSNEVVSVTDGVTL